MTLSTGDTLPEGHFLTMIEDVDGPVALSGLTDGKKVVIFTLPGAYTGTCTTAHIPSFIRNMDALRDHGVDDVICIAVNDPFVLKAWGESTGATEAGIRLLGDSDGAWAKTTGLDFTVPGIGFHGRLQRKVIVAQDSKVLFISEDEKPGVCDLSGGEATVDWLKANA